MYLFWVIYMNALKSDHLATYEIILDKKIIHKLCEFLILQLFIISCNDFYIKIEFNCKDKEFNWRKKEGKMKLNNIHNEIVYTKARVNDILIKLPFSA